MSNRRDSASEYPEHLNPFNEDDAKLRFCKPAKVSRSASFNNSLKHLRNTLTLKSFRGKKPEKTQNGKHAETQNGKHAEAPNIRQKPIDSTDYRKTLATTSPMVHQPLPRSRFSERVSHLDQPKTDTITINGYKSSIPKIEVAPAKNPFDDVESLTSEEKDKKSRRRKKRAPAPPNSNKGDPHNLGISCNESQWSLTSVDTDISTNENEENFDVAVLNEEMQQELQMLTKEIEKLTDDSNNNCIVNVSENKDSVNEKDNDVSQGNVSNGIETTKDVNVTTSLFKKSDQPEASRSITITPSQILHDSDTSVTYNQTTQHITPENGETPSAEQNEGGKGSNPDEERNNLQNETDKTLTKEKLENTEENSPVVLRRDFKFIENTDKNKETPIEEQKRHTEQNSIVEYEDIMPRETQSLQIDSSSPNMKQRITYFESKAGYNSFSHTDQNKMRLNMTSYSTYTSLNDELKSPRIVKETLFDANFVTNTYDEPYTTSPVSPLNSFGKPYFRTSTNEPNKTRLKLIQDDTCVVVDNTDVNNDKNNADLFELINLLEEETQIKVKSDVYNNQSPQLKTTMTDNFGMPMSGPKSSNMMENIDEKAEAVEDIIQPSVAYKCKSDMYNNNSQKDSLTDSNNGSPPVPKLRKHKLTKESLLGQTSPTL